MSGELGKGISRIDQDATHTHGYFVRVGYRRTKAGTYAPRHVCFFGDHSHGGKAKALKAARAYRDAVSTSKRGG